MEKQKKTSTFLLILYGIIFVLFAVFIIQNWQSVTINFFGIKVEGKSFIVFLVTFGIGFFSGWLFKYLRGLGKPKKEARKEKGVKYIEE